MVLEKSRMIPPADVLAFEVIGVVENNIYSTNTSNPFI
jgi:hypothetical protein